MNAGYNSRNLTPVWQLNFTMSGMSSDDASAEVRLEGEVSGEKVEETQDQNEGSGMPSPQEEVLSFPGTIFWGWSWPLGCILFMLSLFQTCMGTHRRQQSRKNMEEKCPKSHHLYRRSMPLSYNVFISLSN